jgi:hypothetical protein
MSRPAVGSCSQTCRVLQWARTHGVPWDEYTCANAAEGGHLAVFQWARANGAPWDEWTCAAAAQGGHLAMLQWARADGAPWDEWTCANAAEGGHSVRDCVRPTLVLGRVTDESSLDWGQYLKPTFVALVVAVIGRLVPFARARRVREALYAPLGVSFEPGPLCALLGGAGTCAAIGLGRETTRVLAGICAWAQENGPPATASDVTAMCAAVRGLGSWVQGQHARGVHARPRCLPRARQMACP